MNAIEIAVSILTYLDEYGYIAVEAVTDIKNLIEKLQTYQEDGKNPTLAEILAEMQALEDERNKRIDL